MVAENIKKKYLQDINDKILHEDNHILVYNKQPSEIVQGDKTGDTPIVELLKQYLKKKYDKPGDVFLGVVHRIDRPVSGIVVFARTSKALTRLNKILHDRQIKKIYWAVTRQPLPQKSGELIHYLYRDRKKNKSFPKDSGYPETKEAKLKYRWLAKSDHFNLYEINLLTGRHHQIRVQLADAGSPIKGDLKYGYPRSNPDGSIHLHAKTVSFIHPVKKETVTFHADPPKDKLWDFFNII